MNGKLIKEPANCDDCGRECKIANGRSPVVFGYFTFGKLKLCRACAKAKKII